MYRSSSFFVQYQRLHYDGAIAYFGIISFTFVFSKTHSTVRVALQMRGYVETASQLSTRDKILSIAAGPHVQCFWHWHTETTLRSQNDIVKPKRAKFLKQK